MLVSGLIAGLKLNMSLCYYLQQGCPAILKHHDGGCSAAGHWHISAASPSALQPSAATLSALALCESRLAQVIGGGAL